LTKQQIILARIFIGYGCLDAVDQDTSSKQEVATVLIYNRPKAAEDDGDCKDFGLSFQHAAA